MPPAAKKPSSILKYSGLASAVVGVAFTAGAAMYKLDAHDKAIVELSSEYKEHSDTEKSVESRLARIEAKLDALKEEVSRR